MKLNTSSSKTRSRIVVARGLGEGGVGVVIANGYRVVYFCGAGWGRGVMTAEISGYGCKTP